MQDNNAEILIENKQISEDGNETFSVSAPCKFMKKDNVYYILYKHEGVTSKIKTDGEEVIVTRMGEFSNEMVYKEGKTTKFLYKMPYGTMDMKLKTFKVLVNLSDDGGIIELSYRLLFSGTKNDNSMKITIKRGDTK